MSSWWIADPQGRVLGPVGLEVVKQLWDGGRLSADCQLCSDGQTWVPIESVSEVVAPSRETPEARAEREKREAAALTQKLQALRSKAPHEVFGVPAGASLDDLRDAFFRVAKPYHPERVPAGADRSLREAHALAFRFYSGLMARLENGLHRPSGATPSNGQPALRREATPPTLQAVARPEPVLTKHSTPARPSPEPYAPETFVGFKALPWGNYQTEIHVTPENVGMFVDHPVMNLKMNGFFLACEERLPMGTYVELRFDFGGTAIETRGKVAMESAGGGRYHRGLGISLFNLDATTRGQLQQLVQKFSTRRQNAGA